MIYRFFVALLFMVFVFPFVVMYTFALTFPDATFAFDQRTWLHGLFPIALGWVIFLLPGMFPFCADRYYPWVGRVTGLTAVIDAIRSGFRSIGSGVSKLNSGARNSISSLPRKEGFLKSLKSGASKLRKKPEEVPMKASAGAAQENVAKGQMEPAAPGILDKARDAIKNPARSIGELRSGIHSMKEKLTPSELQKTILLNHYTLTTFSHLKHILQFKLRDHHESLSPEERGFYESIFSAIPEPPPPGEVNLQSDAMSFVYPPDLRPKLMSVAAKNRISITHEDFVAAEHGDIEKGLLILKAMILDRPVDSRIQVDSSVDDALLGIPSSNDQVVTA